MSSRPRMRPVFTIRLGTDGRVVLLALDRILTSGTTDLVGQVLPEHAVLQLPPSRRSMLSPFLNLELRDEGPQPVLRGRFSPHPNVWTGFMAIYGVIAMLGFGAAVYGLSRWSMGDPPWLVLGLPAAIAAIAFVHGAAVIGQGLTADDMHDLRALVERAVREAGAMSSPPPATPVPSQPT